MKEISRIASHAGVSRARIIKRPIQKAPDTPPTQMPSPPVRVVAAIELPPALDPSERFLNDQIGIDLKVEVIAHDSQAQRALDENQIPWGVQWELARGVTLGAWRWADVMKKLHLFRGTNSAETAYKVVAVMLDLPLPPNTQAAHVIWKELDREQAAIMENRDRGLGLMGMWHGETDWYGGQVQQLARVVKDGKGYSIQLQCMEKRRSHRFARYLGSRRILQLRVPDDLVNRENKVVRLWLQRKFILCGRVFVPFHSKEGNAYLMETNENYDRSSAEWAGDQYRHSFANFINWHNPLHLNEQAISKWSTRFALGLSNSIPAIELAVHNIEFIDDEYADNFDPNAGRKAEAEEILTDGCGFMNTAMAMEIRRVMTYTSIPTAVQGRIAGAKGLWTLHPTNNDLEPKIWIRKSQNKIVLDHFDKAHRIFDLLASSHWSSSAPLTSQSIINLWFNGIPHGLLTNLLENGLREEAQPLMEWDQPNAMIHLWQAINKLGGVTTSRGQRLAANLGRALGLTARAWGHDRIELVDARDTSPIEATPAPSTTNRNPYSGAPASVHENCLEFIQAGFHPSEVIPLRNKIRDVIRVAISSAVDKCRIPLSKSLGAFVIPDPIGVLKPGEIFYKSSQAIKDEGNQTFFNVVTGEVLVGRYPIRLPSDMQRVMAIDEPLLHRWPDVIIVPCTGDYSFASVLSGGDYDGDEPFIIWEPSLVRAFDNKNLFREPEDLKGFFESQVEKVSQFRERVQRLPKQEAQEAFQEVLLLGLFDAKVGMYSAFHEYAIEKYGYDHPETIRIAYLFATLLDSSKSGLRLREGVFEKHSKMFGPWNQPPGALSSSQRREEYILKAIKRAGLRIQDELLELFDMQHPLPEDGRKPIDPQLTAPYLAAREAAKAAIAEDGYRRFQEELDIITEHVHRAYDKWISACRSKRGADAFEDDFGSKKKKAAPSGASKKSEDMFVEAARLFAEPVQGISRTQNVEEIKASYAHFKSTTFGYSVAFRDLCVIKAKANPGGIAPTIRIFDEAKALSHTSLKALTKVDLERI
ncbi:hypothetical protein BDN72DRAFT_158598 [Pluteus cervinus]|uniref:Uncharacterized protein n=1 Tax=Pluteus cervinus TaxID=181527 RepID=A0ACD3AJW7_9AGAR|nr:hypothetical protein BDN72DRAFT_158598 [Pluteus cervinus]